jgi:hypothetical protein
MMMMMMIELTRDAPATPATGPNFQPSGWYKVHRLLTHSFPS